MQHFLKMAFMDETDVLVLQKLSVGTLSDWPGYFLRIRNLALTV